MQEAIEKTVNATRRARVAAPFRVFFGRALDVALPALCPACRELVGGNGLCAPCWSKLSLIAPPYCERLGIPFALAGVLPNTLMVRSTGGLLGVTSIKRVAI